MTNRLSASPARRRLPAWIQRLVGRPDPRPRQPLADRTGRVEGGRVAVFTRLEGRTIRCVAGALWVTVENDREDHVLAPGQGLRVAAPGKVIVGGRGRFQL